MRIGWMFPTNIFARRKLSDAGRLQVLAFRPTLTRVHPIRVAFVQHVCEKERALWLVGGRKPQHDGVTELGRGR